VEPRRRARAFVLGLLAELPRVNRWTLAEHAVDSSPDGMQHLLARAKWDAGVARDDVRGHVIHVLGDPGAVLVIDETGDVKKGTATAGVQRQHTGTAGRIENAQVAGLRTQQPGPGASDVAPGDDPLERGLRRCSRVRSRPG
jgi:SRSO17 transposase